MTTTMTSTQLESRNPADGSAVGNVPVTDSAAIPSIVASAREALASWRSLSIDERAAAIRPAGPALQDRAEELGRLLTREMGKPLAEAIGEVRGCGASLDESIAEISDALAPRAVESDGVQSTLYHDPLGVCAAITPWNFPLAMPHWLVLPALMAGNTVVLKPSEETPLIAQAYVDILNESLPPHVLQIVHGADDQGKALVASDVDLIAFTGSAETGRRIMGAASDRLKRVILELGGKDPMIVLDDADIEAAAAFAARNSFRNAGQVCVSTERIYVSEAAADAFESALVRCTEDIIVGNGEDEGVTVGPMINDRQRDHVLEQIDHAVEQGATILGGGTGHHDNFITPTILGNLSHDMDIMRDETFGPVACVMRVASDDEAVRHANDCEFGLGAVVFGGDLDRASRVARQLDAGMIGVNKSCGGASGTPWVGAKQSGYGYHSGPDGHRQFTQVRVVSLPS